MRTTFFSKTVVLGFIGVMLSFVLMTFLVVQAMPMFGHAQDEPVLQVVCVPSNNQIAAGEPVSFNAQVLSSTQGTVSYAWVGENIQTVNSPQITVSYATPGKKYATTTVAVGNLTEESVCVVDVIGTLAPETNLQVSCAPSKARVARNEPVVWRARVTGAKGSITYRWSGVNITTKNEPAISTSYGSIGNKRATITVTSGGVSTNASCNVEVVGTATQQNPNQPGGDQAGNFADILKNLLSGAQGGTQPGGQRPGGQPGGQPGGNQGGTQPGQQPGGQNEPSSDSPATRLTERQQPTRGNESLGDFSCEPQGESSQSTPTGEYAVPVDTVSINEYIWKLVLKEAGDPTAGTGSEDAKAACEADLLTDALARNAGNWLLKSFGGNPAFIEDWVALYDDLRIIHFEKFVELYKQNKQQSAGGQRGGEDVVLANLEARENALPLFAEQAPQAQQQRGYWENYMAGTNLRGSNLLRFLSAAGSVEAQQAGAIETEKEVQSINRGISDQVDPETGLTIVPGTIAGDVAITRIMNPEARLAGGADEHGEDLDKLKEHIENAPAWLVRKEEMGT